MKILLLGAGRSGVGAAQVLARKHRVRLVNEEVFPEIASLESQGIEVLIENFEETDLSWADKIFKAPGIPFEKKGFRFYNEIEIAAEFAPDYAMYAITGSNGKTTTTRLLEAFLQSEDTHSFAAGNIGYALSQAILDKGNAPYHIALEISAFQLDGLEKVRFPYGAILNLSPDHLDRYGQKENYYASKRKLFDFSEHVFINLDDPTLAKDANHPKSITISLKKDADICLKGNQLVFPDGAKLSLDKLSLKGKHNQYNAAFAASIAYYAGVSIDKIEAVLETFQGVEHRLEYLGDRQGIAYYNDSKATNPEASLAALQGFESPVRLLAGGKDEGNDFSILKEAEGKVKKAYLFGESAEKMRSCFKESEVFETMDEAFAKLQLEMQAGDVVLLSPACASYDQYRNFEERGHAFKKLIKTR